MSSSSGELERRVHVAEGTCYCRVNAAFPGSVDARARFQYHWTPTPFLLSTGSLLSLKQLFRHMKTTSKEFFPGISKIQFEGPKSKNPLAFKHYNPDEVVEGKTMMEQLRFSVTYWHTIRGQLSDMFGVGTAIRPWEDGTNSMRRRETR